MAVSPSLIGDLRSIPGTAVEVDAPLGALTTIRTGGSADALVTIEDADAAVAVLATLRDHEMSACFLGAGSDLLVADAGYEGVVVRLGGGFCEVEGLPDADAAGFSSVGGTSYGDGTQYCVTAGGAMLVSALARRVAEAGLSGLEFACGIPGSVGGGVATNAGAYGRAFADALVEVQLARADGVTWVDAQELDWQYRHCRLPQGVLVTAARFRLGRDAPEAILERHREILDMRRVAQPQEVRTFGSTFKNPSGGAAGRLLDAAGLRGERRGGAEISKVHANFVINLGEASTTDVLTLMSCMRQRVHETSGVWLEPEVRLLGACFPWEASADQGLQLPLADG